MSQIIKALKEKQRSPRLKLVDPIDGNQIMDSDYLLNKRKAAKPNRALLSCLMLAIAGSALFFAYKKFARQAPPVTKTSAAPSDPQEVIRNALSKGVDEYNAKNYAQALKTLLAVLPDAKANPALLNDLGMVYEKTSDLKSAKDYFEAAIQADPKDASAYNNLGMLKAMQGNVKGAIQDLRQAVSLSQAHPALLINLARICERDGLWSESLKLYLSYIAHPQADPTLRPLLEKRVRKIHSLAQFEKRMKGET